MVDSGHSIDGEIVDLGYANPDRPQLGLEAMTFRGLRARTKPRVAESPIRADFHQLFVVRGGHGRSTVDFVAYDCGPGTVLHVRPGQVMRLPAKPDRSGSEGLADLDAVVVLFTADFPPRLPSAVTSLLDLEFGPVALAASAAPADESEALLRSAADIDAEYRSLNGRDEAAVTVSVELLRQTLGALLLRIARLPRPAGFRESGVGGATSAVFLAYRREVERSFAASRDVQDYAERLGYAPRTLTRACLAATGKTAKEFLDARVALEAKRLLVNTELTVAAIARAVGFSEATNFGKFFTREAGMTPGVFRTAER
jgi:AraC-like DNA-binding protein